MEFRCSRCGITKCFTQFSRSSATSTGFHEWCKQCRKETRTSAQVRENMLTYHYGIDGEDYEKISKEQEGKCAICGEKPERLCVDHDHKTEIIRGLLCSRCNKMLGAVGDNVEILEAAIKYLKKPRTLEVYDILRKLQYAGRRK